MGMESVSTVFVVKADATPTAIPKDTLGQLADYASAIWASQPTRKFVPLFYIHGEYLWLVLFYRGMWSCFDIGQICFTVISGTFMEAPVIHLTLKMFWFLLTLPTEDFGHYCSVSGAVTQMQFYSTAVGNNESSVFKDVSANPSGTTNVLAITKPIQQHLSICGPVAYLYYVVFNGKTAVFKLAWAKVTETPEGAVYELLHRFKVPGVPKVYDSGILIKDLRGFRLEYLIIKDCGQPILDYINSNTRGDTSQIAKELVAHVCECLVSAYCNGVLHRDISPGNIVVRKGVARVIDWGYANIFDFGSEDAKQIANKWQIDRVASMENSNFLVGTFRYMSINVLSQSKMRGLFDDLESLFYVILNAFSTRRTSNGEQDPICFRFYDLETLGSVRAMKLYSDSWLKSFGVVTISRNTSQLFNAMHTFLFKQGNRYIGHELFENNGFNRAINVEVTREFMNNNTIEMLHNVPKFAADNIIPVAITDLNLEFSNTSMESSKDDDVVECGNSESRLSKKIKY
ncbi:hypothetical protein GGI05_000586 [Coemansia sp. RSA 2603]|nr:hypothetical protein GGI05_000586 [Coemansia sp. RSA 2603]